MVDAIASPPSSGLVIKISISVNKFLTSKKCNKDIFKKILFDSNTILNFDLREEIIS